MRISRTVQLAEQIAKKLVQVQTELDLAAKVDVPRIFQRDTAITMQQGHLFWAKIHVQEARKYLKVLVTNNTDTYSPVTGDAMRGLAALEKNGMTEAMSGVAQLTATYRPSSRRSIIAALNRVQEVSANAQKHVDALQSAQCNYKEQLRRLQDSDFAKSERQAILNRWVKTGEMDEEVTELVGSVLNDPLLMLSEAVVRSARLLREGHQFNFFFPDVFSTRIRMLIEDLPHFKDPAIERVRQNTIDIIVGGRWNSYEQLGQLGANVRIMAQAHFDDVQPVAGSPRSNLAW